MVAAFDGKRDSRGLIRGEGFDRVFGAYTVSLVVKYGMLANIVWPLMLSHRGKELPSLGAQAKGKVFFLWSMS